MAQQSIPAVSQGVVKLPDGRGFNLESTEGTEWLDSATSFRFESSRGHYSQVKLKALLSMSNLTHILPVDPIKI